MSKLADNDEELVLEDQTIVPGSPKTSSKDSDEVVQLLVTVEIENGEKDEVKEKETEEKNHTEEVIKNGEANPNQICKEVKDDEEKEEKSTTGPPEEVLVVIEDIKEDLPPPPPPKRTNQTNQRLKKLSKMIKYTIPSKMPSPLMPSKKSSKVERKSLKDKLTDNDLTAFLKERRAVSESRFRTLDKRRSPSPTGLIERTRSDPDMSNQDDPDKTGSKEGGPMAIAPGNFNSLVEKFERQSSPQPVSPTRSLKSPSRDLKSPELVNRIEKTKTPSPSRNTIKTYVTPVEPDKQSTTSPESGMDDNNKSENESKKGSISFILFLSKQFNYMLNYLSGSKKSKKEKKDRRRSGCEACHSDKEHKEHRKDKKKSKKDPQKRKKVTINSDTEGRKSKNRPPMPKSEDLGPPKDGFFKQLLIMNEQEKMARQPSPTHSQPIQRSSRHSQQKRLTAVQMQRPSFNAFLKEKKAVSDSKFIKDSNIERSNSPARYLPPGILQGEQYFEHRSKFDNGMKPVATFPRSLSNLEKRSASASEKPTSLERPNSSMSRGSSLPRPGSATSIDHEEYKNYVLEMIHATQKNPRFQQLQAYYSILDKALKLEKKSSDMEIHKLKSEAVVDFETWRKLRGKEKAKDELNFLLGSLRDAQKAGNFHFRPKEVEEVRWRGDIRLRARDKSVENLKNHFSKIAAQNGVTEEVKQKVTELNETKDVYRPKWRATTVNNNIKRLQSPSGKLQANTLPRSTKSSLTQHQVNQLKGQLTEILDNSRSASKDTYEIQVNKITDDVKAKLESQNLFVKPLKPEQQKSMQEIKVEQKELSFKIGQEIKSRQQPRVFDQDEKNDFLLVLTSPTNNEEVKATMESWSGNQETEPNERPKSVNELAKSYEGGLNKDSMSPTRALSPPVETNYSVKEVKRSFEKLPDQSNGTKTPVRTSSFCKAIEQGQKYSSLGKLSKSTSSLENVLDDEPPSVGLNHFNDMSMSNPDISDNESAAKNIRDCFQKLGSQLSMSNSNPYLDPTSPLMNHYGHYGQKVDNTTKYSRAYLTLVKGSVNNKLSKFEDPRIPRGYSQKLIHNTYVKGEKPIDYIKRKGTDTRKVVIKTKEVGNVNDTVKRLEMRAKSPITTIFPPPEADVVQVPPQPKVSLTWTDQKAKLKHFCKKMSHSKILNKMIALQCASQNQTLDKGTEKLLMKNNQEEVLKTVYQSGKVELKVNTFERPAHRPQSPVPVWAAKTETSFSWSKRLNPQDSASDATKHNQFRKYYGYHPGGGQPRSLLGDNQIKADETQPASLPTYLENLPPPPPIRGAN